MNNNLINKKKEFRKTQFIVRKKLFSNITKVFNKIYLKKFFKIINFDTINVVSSFISINSEIKTNELNNYILKIKIIFTSYIKKDDHLIFRKFINNQDLIEGFMKIEEPHHSNEILVPELLFVPCLAFDTYGFRLGYGGGYYDKTFSYLKNNKIKFISVGYAFDGQKVSEVPKDKFDIKLDYVITEKKFYSFV